MSGGRHTRTGGKGTRVDLNCLQAQTILAFQGLVCYSNLTVINGIRNVRYDMILQMIKNSVGGNQARKSTIIEASMDSR